MVANRHFARPGVKRIRNTRYEIRLRLITATTTREHFFLPRAKRGGGGSSHERAMISAFSAAMKVMRYRIPPSRKAWGRWIVAQRRDGGGLA
jgi:hypothetical protein